jgi:hypothetical protein
MKKGLALSISAVPLKHRDTQPQCSSKKASEIKCKRRIKDKLGSLRTGFDGKEPSVLRTMVEANSGTALGTEESQLGFPHQPVKADGNT